MFIHIIYICNFESINSILYQNVSGCQAKNQGPDTPLVFQLNTKTLCSIPIELAEYIFPDAA